MSVYAYADESGHSGPNIFDPEQPVFYSAAVISGFDLDLTYRPLFDELAKTQGFTSLHAAEMGMGRLIPLLPKIQERIKKDNVRFFLGRVVKRDLVVAKIFDTIFDPHENRAVPYHIYWAMPLRHIGVLKLAHIVTDSILSDFWEALMERNGEKSLCLFTRAVQALKTRVPMIPDARSRQIFSEAFEWAIAYPNEIGFHNSRKKLALGHLPNMVAFPEMLRAIDAQAEFWKTDVRQVKHDRQSQIQSLLREWHHMLSNAGEGTFRVWEREVKFRVVAESDFQISSSSESAGIQLADLVMWLFKRFFEKGNRDEVVLSFLRRVERNSTPFELSMSASSHLAAEMMAKVDAGINEETQFAKGHELLRLMEARRQEGLRAFPLPRAAPEP